MKIGIYITEWRQQRFEEFVTRAVWLSHRDISPEIVFAGDGLVEARKGFGVDTVRANKKETEQ